jgi:Beta-ketoacyl synthase, C-terminal domain
MHEWWTEDLYITASAKCLSERKRINNTFWSMGQVIREALIDSNSASSQVIGLEMHGTGTPLGDPIEMGAATAVFCSDRKGEGSHQATHGTSYQSRMKFSVQFLHVQRTVMQRPVLVVAKCMQSLIQDWSTICRPRRYWNTGTVWRCSMQCILLTFFPSTCAHTV